MSGKYTDSLNKEHEPISAKYDNKECVVLYQNEISDFAIITYDIKSHSGRFKVELSKVNF